MAQVVTDLPAILNDLVSASRKKIFLFCEGAAFFQVDAYCFGNCRVFANSTNIEKRSGFFDLLLFVLYLDLIGRNG